MSKRSEEVVVEAVQKDWKDNYPRDVIAFFEQKYSFEVEWESCAELASPKSSDDSDTVVFLNDFFCKGQDCIRNVVIVPLKDITDYYAKHHKTKPQNANEQIVILEQKDTKEEQLKKMQKEIKKLRRDFDRFRTWMLYGKGL